MKPTVAAQSILPIVRRLAAAVGMVIAVVLLMMWLMGVFHPKQNASRPVAKSVLNRIR